MTKFVNFDMTKFVRRKRPVFQNDRTSINLTWSGGAPVSLPGGTHKGATGFF
jgi:hypothetical protein